MRIVDAADTTGRPMHAGLTALAWPDDPLGQLWHACTVLREHRGDGHLAACVAAVGEIQRRDRVVTPQTTPGRLL